MCATGKANAEQMIVTQIPNAKALLCTQNCPFWSAAAWRRFVIADIRGKPKRRQAAALQKTTQL